MKVYLKYPRSPINAVGEYNLQNNNLVVLKGTVLSKDISCAEKFRSAKIIEKMRSSVKIENGVLQEDVVFKSPSTAGNFVTGRSTNGLKEWKNKNGIALKILIGK